MLQGQAAAPPLGVSSRQKFSPMENPTPTTNLLCTVSRQSLTVFTMAAVYKSLSTSSIPKSSKSSASVNGTSQPKNKQRVLLLSSRGVTYRHRHLLNDIHSLLPHSRKDAKLDTKTKLYQLNELADLYNCNNVLFFEARKGKDLYVWMSKAPNGPTIKMHMQNRTFIISYLTALTTDYTCSAYNVRASLPWKLSERFSPYPLLRRNFHLATTPPRHQRAALTCFWRAARRTEVKTFYRPCNGLCDCRWQDMDTMLSNHGDCCRKK